MHKSIGKNILCSILEWQVRRLRRKYQFKVVAVAGSLGKTSTKYAIAQLLSQNLRVRFQAGNYNDRATVPLVFFGEAQPALFNIAGWLKVMWQAERQIASGYPFDVVVVELGSDGPGQLAKFAYTKPDLAVVTAVAEEHMEYFKQLDAVAEEELGIIDFSKQVLVNVDDTPAKYLEGRTFKSYGLDAQSADYTVKKRDDRSLAGQAMTIALPEGEVQIETPLVGLPGATAALAAVATGDLLGLSKEELVKSMPQVLPYAGRMQILRGQQGSTLMDDTYNAAPRSFKAALDTLYVSSASQRIAILGSINEMGDLAEGMHREVGEYCDPTKLDLVVTVGDGARRWLAPAAREKGCTVHEFLSPYEAGKFVLNNLQSGAVVLAKGSQNGVFTEEALKQLLKDPADVEKLVRQSASWMKAKSRQFPNT